MTMIDGARRVDFSMQDACMASSRQTMRARMPRQANVTLPNIRVAPRTPMRPRNRERPLRRVTDRQVADTVDVTRERVAALHCADTGRRAGVDQVARQKRHQLREVRDLLGNRPDELVDVAGLLADAIDVEPDRAACRMADLRRAPKIRARRGLVERLA